MWIYQQDKDERWEVGFYDPKGKFHEESAHDDQAAAAHRVHFLNGGTLPYRPSAGGVTQSAQPEPQVVQEGQTPSEDIYDPVAARARKHAGRR